MRVFAGPNWEGKIYAIFESHGKQYKASLGEVLKLDLLSGKGGERVELEQVLFIGNEDKILAGRPFIEGAKIRGTILEHGKGDKVTVFKYKPKVRYRRKKGYRWPYSKVLIEEIVLPEGEIAWRTKRRAEVPG